MQKSSYSIVIPAHNEEAFLSGLLDSVVNQSHLPTELIVVDDHSSDSTSEIANFYAAKYNFISCLTIESSTKHQPGSKVVNAFLKGYEQLTQPFDFIVKLDADLILPPNYFECCAQRFTDEQIGVFGGIAFEANAEGEFVRNHPMNTDHVRGAFKAYSAKCYEAIGGLRPTIGWDTLDELLALYHQFTVVTDESLQVRHLRATGQAYKKESQRLQGEIFYRLRYSTTLAVIAAAKLALAKKNVALFFDSLKGFHQAKAANSPYLVTKEEGEFITTHRWKGIRQKIFS